MDGWMDAWMGGCMDAWMDVVELVGGWTNTCVWMVSRMNAEAGDSMSERVSRNTDEWNVGNDD